MAQHIPVETIQNKRIEEIVQGIRKQKYFHTSMRYQEVEKNVFQTHRNVPKSLVHGGRATFEVHTNDHNNIEKIYLVA